MRLIPTWKDILIFNLILFKFGKIRYRWSEYIHRMLNILIKWMIWAKKNWSEVWATTKNCFCVADILIMRVFLWHRFMIISGYSKYETKDVRFQREWVFYSRIKPKRKNEGYLVWYELCTACIHEDTSWMRFGENIFSINKQ